MVRKRTEQVDQQWIEIHQIVFMILRGEPDEVGNGLVGTIENGVQQPLIYRDISVRGGLQKLIGRNAIVAPRLKESDRSVAGNYSSSLTTLTAISAVTSRCSRSGTLNSPSDLDRLIQRDLAALDRVALLLPALRRCPCDVTEPKSWSFSPAFCEW